MSERSMTSNSRSGLSKSSLSTTKSRKSTMGLRRRGRKSRSSGFGSSRSRLRAGSSSVRSKKRPNRVMVDGVDVTPLSLLPPTNQDGVNASTAGNGSTATSNRTQATSSLQRKQDSSTTLTVEPPISTKAASVTDLELEKDVVITLTETNTIELFHLRGYVVHQESDQQRIVTARNDAYKNLFERRKNKDLFASAAAQTLNPSSKDKTVQAEPPLTRDAEVTATNWDIYDSQTKTTEAEDWGHSTKDKDDESRALPSGVKDLVTMCLATPGSLLNLDPDEAAARQREKETAGGLDAGRQALQEKAANRILSSSALNKSLRLVERIIQQGYYHNKQLAYNDLPPIIQPQTSVVANVRPAKAKVLKNEAKLDDAESKEVDEEASTSITSEARNQHLELQWSFKCDLTKGRNVSSMVWNPLNPNLLAVAYGAFEFGENGAAGAQDGMILFWSLKNPEFPERTLKVSSGVTSIDFSTLRPHLLAVGLYNGAIAIFDTRQSSDQPIFESNIESGSHTDTVWQIKWIVRNADAHLESLISLSTDGRVKEWTMKKGLSHIDLMTLKRVPNQTGPQWKPDNSKGEGVISRLGNGMCFSFPKSVSDTVVYFVGTEDGVIHKCSSSYNEQYLGSYHGHTGPVYQIKCHPLDPNVFLSCSADWAVKLWSVDKEDDSELTFHQNDLNDVVHDVEWAPHNGTVFASVTADGRIEVWDVHNSALVPTICHRVEKVVDEDLLEIRLADARAELLKKKKKKRADTEFDEFADEDEDKKTEEDEDADLEVDIPTRVKKLSCVRFANGTQIIVTGDDTGAVDVYKVFGLNLGDALHRNKAQQIEHLRRAMRPAPVRNTKD